MHQRGASARTTGRDWQGCLAPCPRTVALQGVGGKWSTAVGHAGRLVLLRLRLHSPSPSPTIQPHRLPAQIDCAPCGPAPPRAPAKLPCPAHLTAALPACDARMQIQKHHSQHEYWLVFRFCWPRLVSVCLTWLLRNFAVRRSGSGSSSSGAALGGRAPLTEPGPLPRPISKG